MNAHALLAPSAADRWVSCPGSVQMSKGKGNHAGMAAAEGSVAHIVLEKTLTGKPLPLVGEPIEHGIFTVYVDQDMLDRAAFAADYVRSLGAGYLYVEQRVDPGIHPDCWGTADIIHLSSQRVLTVADYKYGYVDVPVAGNKQLLIYAKGGVNHVGDHNVDYVQTVIIQPKARNGDVIKQTWVGKPELMGSITDALTEAAISATTGRGDVKAGSWCRYCNARLDCPALDVHKVTLAEMFETPVKELTAAQAEWVWDNRMVLTAALKDVENTVLSFARHKQLVGLKLVAGRTNETWVDEDTAKHALVQNVGLDALKPRTPRQVKNLPGVNVKWVESLTVTPEGKPSVVPKSSNMRELDPAAAFSEADSLQF